MEGGREGGTPVVCETCCVYVRETEKRGTPVMCMRPVVCICEREREREIHLVCLCEKDGIINDVLRNKFSVERFMQATKTCHYKK